MKKRSSKFNKPNWLFIGIIALVIVLIILTVINFQSKKKEQKELESSLRKDLYIDPLTLLHTRRGLERHLETLDKEHCYGLYLADISGESFYVTFSAIDSCSLEELLCKPHLVNELLVL